MKLLPKLLLLTSVLLILFAFSAKAQISSTFDTDADGWIFSRAGIPQTVNHNPSNGNPGGYVSVTYSSNTTVASEGWFAPVKFLGSQVARSYGMNLRFDLQQAFAGTASSGQGDVRIRTYGSHVIVFSLPVKPAVAPAWSSYTIKLDETAGWRVTGTGGALATKTDVLRALSDIETLEIRGTYITNASNISGLDNVVIEQKTLTTAPTITSFTPLSGIPATSLTISGNNFGATAGQNSVFFGTTKATITSGNATQLNVTVPGGAQFGPVTVINLTTGLIAQSLQNFTPLFNNNNDIGGRIIPSSLDIKDDLTLDASHVIRGLSLGDLDGDGLVDIIVTEPSASTSEISVFRNLGVTGDINASSFAPKITLGRGYDENAVTDLDGDGKLDIVVIDTDSPSGPTSSFFVTYRNISTPGTIAFEAAESFVNPSYSTGAMHVSDIDGDGRLDLMGTHPSTGASYYFWTTQNLSSPGDILFGAGVVWDNGLFAGSSDISTGDLDGDGKVEIVVAHGNTFSIFPNQSTPGTITLGSGFLIDPTNTVKKVEIADLDNDSKPDLVWATGDLATAIRIRKNIHSSGALTPSSFDPEIVIGTTAFAADDLTLADMNADGKLDIVATNARDLGIFQSNFNGTLSPSSFMKPVLFQGNTFLQYPFKPIVADLDGDNKPDVVSATISNPTQIFIYRNTCFPTPTINSVSPTTGEAGASLTVSGNFMNTNFDTPTVKFGLVPANAGSISNTSLTTPIPAGAQSDRVSVALHGLTAFSTPLNVTFPTSRTIDATSFGTPTEFALTTATDGLTVADFDDDGKKDVVVNDNSIVKIFRNTLSSAGSAITTTTLTGITTTIAQAVHVTATDIDGDGKVDLIANSGVHRNNSGSTADAISFEPFIQSVISGANGFVVDHDFNHDGKSDFAITTNGNTYQVNENASRKGSFTYAGGGVFSTIVNSGISIAAGGQVIGITGGDFDGDGYSDFAYGANGGPDILAVVRNTGLNQPLAPAQFEAAVTFLALDVPFSIASADFDGDGKLDIVLGNNNAAFISIYRNTSTAGSISFLAKQDVAALTRAVDIEAVDLDGDGKPEIIVAHQPTATTGSFTVFQNTSTPGTISFASAVNYALTRGPLSLIVADLNLDSRPDLLFTANGTTDALMVFENLIPSTLPTITSFTPANGPVATTVIITGTNFNTTPANNTVQFNGVTAVVSASTATSITTTVPAGATTGPIAVTVGGNTATSATDFTVTVPSLPTITSFTPASGPVGTTVTITGTNFSTTPSNNTVQFNGTTAVVSASTTTSITTTVPAGATTGKITVAVGGNTATSATDFTVLCGLMPTITSFSPSSGTVGTTVTITGTNFSTTPANNIVNFNGTSAVVTASTATTITTKVPAAAGTGPISVQVDCNTATSSGNFTVTCVPAPTITSFSPTFGDEGDIVTITGTNFSTTPTNNLIDFNGVPAVITASTSTSITVEVPVGITTGPISLSLDCHYITSATDFNVKRTIVITTQPTSVAVCTSDIANISTAATGADNLIYQWQYSPDGVVPFTDIVDGAVYSDATTETLVVNTNGNVGAGRYRCRISGDYADPVLASEIGLSLLTTECAPQITVAALTTEPGGKIILDLKPLITTIGTLQVSSIKVKAIPLSGALTNIENGILTIDYTGTPFSGTEFITIEACNTNGICSQQDYSIEVVGDMMVYNAVTPNGDDKNSIFRLNFIDLLPETKTNEVFIYNRWGVEVFSISDYDNKTRVFAGLTNDGNKLPAGIYFYKIMLPLQDKTLTGFLDLRY